MSDVSAADEPNAGARERAMRDFAARSINLGGTRVSERAAVELLGRLEQRGVEALLLKGPALARLLYRPGEHRGFFDVDVLVDPADLRQARETLARLGYENRSERAGIDNFHGAVHGETWARPGAAAIDLHWRLDGCDAPPEAAWRRLYAGRTSVDLDGRRTAVPGRDALALQLALHVANHGPDSPKAVGDLVRGLERWPAEDWRAAARLAQQLEATPAFAAGLRRVPEGATMARELGLGPTPQLDWTIAHRHLRPRGTFHVRALREASGWRARAEVLRRSLLPRREWVIWHFPWAGRGGPAIIAAYAAHLLRAPLWAARAWRFDRLARRRAEEPGARRR